MKPVADARAAEIAVQHETSRFLNQAQAPGQQRGLWKHSCSMDWYVSQASFSAGNAGCASCSS